MGSVGARSAMSLKRRRHILQTSQANGLPVGKTLGKVEEMMTRGRLLGACISASVLPLSPAHAGTEATAAPTLKKISAASRADRPCRANEEAFRVLKLTTIEGGLRVDYEFVRSGQASWTNMNRPLLRQFGVRIGGTICLPRDPLSDESTDFD